MSQRCDDGIVGWNVTRPGIQGMQEASISWERQGNEFFPVTSYPLRLWTPDHNCKRIHLCCLQQSYLWQLLQQQWETNTLGQFREWKYGHTEGQSPLVIVKINLVGHDWHFKKLKQKNNRFCITCSKIKYCLR